MKGLFITFEGAEASGKSTQIALLAERLRQAGRAVRTVREPGGAPICEEIRQLVKHSEAGRGMSAETELLLMNASRAQLVREVIRPALAAGEAVLSDRFFDSTVAYQAFGRGLDAGIVKQMNAFAAGETVPDLTLLLAVPLAVSEARRAARPPETASGGDRIEQAGRAFFERVEEGYRHIAAAEPQRVRVIDGAVPAPAVHAAIWAAVEPLLRR